MNDTDLNKAYDQLERRWQLIHLVAALPVLAIAGDLLLQKAKYFDVATGNVLILVLFLIPLAVQFYGVKILTFKVKEARDLFFATRAKETRTQAAEGEIYNENRRAYEALIYFSKFYLSTMFYCISSYCILWLIYIWGKKQYEWEGIGWNTKNGTVMFGTFGYFCCSLLAIAAISFLLYRVMRMTHAIIAGVLSTTEADDNADREANGEWLYRDYLKRGAAQAPFLGLLFFLTVFLAVSYLFGFALAFHDKTQAPNRPGLVMRNLNPSPPPTSSIPAPSPNTFGFASGTAQIPDMNESCESTGHANSHALQKIVETIKRETTEDNPIRVTIVGKADMRQINPASNAYQSNYELAEARAQYIKRKLMADLSTETLANDNQPRNIEWLCVSEPREALAAQASKRPPRTASVESPADRVVEVFVERNAEGPASYMARQTHADSLTLMDYVYFANYTITTTGYGDIVPNTAYTKFICSFANICEVFFLVVFFNSLLSLRGSQPEHEMPHRVGDLHNKYIVKRNDELISNKLIDHDLRLNKLENEM
jgi:hypothetical protein